MRSPVATLSPVADKLHPLDPSSAELIQNIRAHRIRSEAFERQRYEILDEPGRARVEERIAYHQLQIAILLRRVAETTRGRVIRVRR